MRRIILMLLVTCFVAVGCKNEVKEAKKDVKTEVKKENIAGVSFKISGMTCEMGCAKHIALKLSKLDGVVEANVVFADSIAKVRFDKTKTDASKLMTYVEGLADSKYKASGMKVCESKCDTSIEECSKEKKASCKEKKACNEKCANNCSKDKMACSCSQGCSTSKTEKKSACSTDCKKPCCTKA